MQTLHYHTYCYAHPIEWGGCSPQPLTFSTPPPMAWQSPVQRWRIVVEWRAQEERLSVCERLLCGGAPMQEVGCVVECHCVPCGGVGIVCGLSVGFRWLVKISWRMGVRGWCCCRCVSQYIKCTLLTLYSCHCPAVDIIESGWVSFTSWMSFTWSFVLLHSSC